MGQPFSVAYNVQNLTLHLAELVILVDPTDGISFAGYKQSIFRVLPHAKYTFKFNLIAKKCGQLQLPRVRVLKRSDVITMSDNTLSVGKELESKCFSIMTNPGNLVPDSNALHIHVFPFSSAQ